MNSRLFVDAQARFARFPQSLCCLIAWVARRCDHFAFCPRSDPHPQNFDADPREWCPANFVGNPRAGRNSNTKLKGSTVAPLVACKLCENPQDCLIKLCNANRSKVKSLLNLVDDQSVDTPKFHKTRFDWRPNRARLGIFLDRSLSADWGNLRCDIPYVV